MGDVAEFEGEVESEKILLSPIPTQADKVLATKAVSKLLKEVRCMKGNDDEPNYEIENVKVDLKGLAKALLGSDMKQKQTSRLWTRGLWALGFTQTKAHTQ